jgi:hypothetical protein
VKTLIGIIGSRSRNSEEDFKAVLMALKALPIKLTVNNVAIVSGGCKKGGDSFAKRICDYMKIEYIEFPPQVKNGCTKQEYAKACYERNTEIAMKSDILIACWDKESRGTLNTINTFKNNKPENILIIC